MGKDACDVDSKTCLKETNAACFHSKQLVHDHEKKRMTVIHMFGCAALEKGSNGSHLTVRLSLFLKVLRNILIYFKCNMHRSPHSKPYSIACCYEGHYCNLKIQPPQFSNFKEDLRM